ncbi:patatin-like phospholipase domain-containing protein 2 isoform X4 [Tachysurus fulvidraco]|uniref:patatin-like phospholipase domain-containing protein 2 isoform X4 n=1 Tax=Tachysurus fulvidraco TaxID=1234273 RepID=UPI001FEE6549|nr:patatin-like phospholipase domain-containing protein 2 isoform X4 [Tachysurus fulvidraco]
MLREACLRNMLTQDTEWNISFAGCGFLGIYYFGVYSCLLERAQHLIKSTRRICGASSGALIAAMIVCQMSPAKCCENLMAIAKEARKGMLSSMHPSFNLLKLTRQLMIRDLPDNAHLLASGKLFVSLTRLSDGKNVLVSEFTSRDDLIQALFCSCFFPVYCGVVPPCYHGTHYVDGALSDSTPYSSLKNTITVSPFSGESDICPDDNPVYCQEVMAEICNNGYKDALVYLKENANHKLNRSTRGKSSVLDKNLLPVPVQKVFSDASTKKHGRKRELFALKLLTSILMVCILPLEVVGFILLRLASWMVEMASDLLRRYRWMKLSS